MNEKLAFHSFKDRVYYMKKAKTGVTANVKEPTYELAEKRSLLGFLYKYYGKKSLEETARPAIAQIRERKYSEELKMKGITDSQIKEYGVAFEGKTVLIVD